MVLNISKVLDQIVKEKGKFLYDLEMGSASTKAGAVYETDTLSAKDVNRMHRKAYREFYLRPIQLWKALNLKILNLRTLPDLVRYSWHVLFQGGQFCK